MTDDDIREIEEGLEAEEAEEAPEVADADELELDEAPLEEAAPEPSTDEVAEPEPEPSTDEVAEPEPEPWADEVAESEPYALEVGPAPDSWWAVEAEPLPGESELEPLSAEELAANAALGGMPPVDTANASLMDFGPEERDKTWIWWTLTAVAVLATVAIAVWWWVDLRAIAVPDVTGKPSAEAVLAICESGLGLGEVTEVATDTAAPGTVIEQKPAGGAQVRPDSVISIVLAAEPVTTKVPDVSAKKQEEAEEELAKAGLRAVVVESYDTTAVPGFVISQLPSAGVEMPPGSAVALAVSTGPRPTTITVPKLDGMNTKDADQLLTSLGLIPENYRSIDPSKTAGTVIAQSPTPGAAAALNDRVLYVVADAPSATSVVVPNVVGFKRSAADKELKARGLVSKFTVVSHRTVPKDQVIIQMPLAGSRTVKGATVGMLVSRGATETLTVPDLTGLASAETTAAINKAGFRPVVIEVPVIGQTPGNVVGQYPAAGTEWYYRFPVIAIVVKP